MTEFSLEVSTMSGACSTERYAFLPLPLEYNPHWSLSWFRIHPPSQSRPVWEQKTSLKSGISQGTLPNLIIMREFHDSCSKALASLASADLNYLMMLSPLNKHSHCTALYLYFKLFPIHPHSLEQFRYHSRTGVRSLCSPV